MPVITRSQSANVQVSTDRHNKSRSDFAKGVKSFINHNDNPYSTHQENTERLTKTFKFVNKNFIKMYAPDELRLTNPQGFNKVINTIYNRCVYLSNDIHEYNDIKKNTKKEFLETINKTMNMLKPYVDQITNVCRRSKRNIPRVNYADLLNRDEEYDFADESEDDEDYVYESEDDVEEEFDDEEDDEDVREAAEALVQMKNKKHTTITQPLRRSNRKVARVNYAEY